jgi:hypothetical protein
VGHVVEPLDATREALHRGVGRLLPRVDREDSQATRRDREGILSLAMRAAPVFVDLNRTPPARAVGDVAEQDGEVADVVLDAEGCELVVFARRFRDDD